MCPDTQDSLVDELLYSVHLGIVIISICNYKDGDGPTLSKKSVIASATLPLVLLSGCASIVDGSNQSLSVATISSSGDVPGASCELNSNKGTWFVTTPGSVTVHRGYDALNVKCTKDGYEPAVQMAKSSTKGMTFGNILFGGVIGAGVDMGTGAAYDYPDLITVMMQPKATPSPAPVASAAAPSDPVVAEASK